MFYTHSDIIFLPITTILQSSPLPLSQVDNINICPPYLGLSPVFHKLFSATLSTNSSYSLFLSVIKYICLVMSERYIHNHFSDIKQYASVIEQRMDDEYCKLETVLDDNIQTLKMCQKYQVDYLLIDTEYEVHLEL